MPLETAFNSSETISFVVKNNSSINRAIKVFNTKIGPGNSLDIMKIPGVTEEDIRTSVLKGSLKSLISGGSLQVTLSTVNFQTVDSAQAAFLRSIGINPSGVSGSAVDPLTQANWYIDANLGSDLNDGSTSATALKTFAELSRRWGTNNIINPGDGLVVTINILSDLPATDPIQFQAALGPTVSLLFKGGTPTQLATGAFSAVTAKNRATNQALEATTVGITWANYRADGSTPARIRDTTNNSVFYVLKDLGSGVARFSEPVVPFTTELSLASGFIPAGTPGGRPSAAVSVSDTWVAESLVKVHLGAIEIVPNHLTTVGTGSSSNVGFTDLTIDRASGSYPNWGMRGLSVFNVIWSGCIIQKGIVINGEHFASYCAFRRGILSTAGFARLNACAFLGSMTLNNSGIFIDFDTVFQGGATPVACNGIAQLAGSIKIGTAACFDITPGVNNSTGAGVNVQGTTVHVGGGGLFGDTTHALWGSGNTGAGVDVSPGSTFLYLTNAPTITGAAGDFRLATATTSRAWDDGYVDGYGRYTQLISNTWANLVLPIGSGGLGEAALNVGKQAKLIKGVS